MNQTLLKLSNRTGYIADRVVLKLVQCGKKSLADIRHISAELWADIWYKFIKRADTHVAKMQKAIKPLLVKQMAEVMENIKKNPPPKTEEPKGYKADALTPEQRRFIDLWMYDRDKWRKEFMATGEPFIISGLVDGGKDALDKLGIDPAEFVTDEAIIAHARTQALAMATSVTDSVADLLKTQFVEALQVGESVTDMMTRIQSFATEMPEWKSRQIAQTEMISAVNHGAMEGNKQSGVVWGTQWVAALDERTRDSHREMTENEEAVPLGEQFSNGCEYPGDQNGDPEETVSCRCTTKPLTEGPNGEQPGEEPWFPGQPDEPIQPTPSDEPPEPAPLTLPVEPIEPTDIATTLEPVIDKNNKQVYDNLISQGISEKDIKTIENNYAKVLEKNDVFTRISDKNFEKVVAEGRFKTQFETQASGGYYNINERARLERWQFGYARDMAPENRPIYGFVGDRKNIYASSEIPDKAFRQTKQYGDIIINFKSDIKARSTITYTDSYRETAVPTLLNSPKIGSFVRDEEAYYMRKLPVKPESITQITNVADSPYIEVQMHGGVRLSDIKEVIIGTDSNGLSVETIKILKDNGIKVIDGAGAIW